MARPKNAILSREKVVAATIAMIGQGGLEAFSMPKLATALGVRAPSLYHYFDGKDALMAAAARTVATPEPPSALPANAHWTDYLVSVSVALRRTITDNPQCAPLLVRFMPRRNMFDESEQICRYLTASGVPARLHLRIIDGMTALTIGAAILNENSAHYTDGGHGPTPDPENHPTLRIALATVGDDNPEQHFEKLLRIFLDGVIREIPDHAPPNAAKRHSPKKAGRGRKVPAT